MKIFVLLVLLTVNILLYFPSIQHDFLKDDFRLIVENQRIKSFKMFINSLNGQFFSFPDFPYLHYWRPLSLFTFYLDYQIWGLNPMGYHLTNILLNALNALLIFLFFYFISQKVLLPFFIALFFSIHPVHVEAVSWVSGRTDLLAAFFVFAALLLLLLYLDKGKKIFYLLAVICFIPALLAKENALLFPLAAAFLIAMDITKKSTRKKWYLVILPFVVIDIIFLIFHRSFTGMQNLLENFSFKDISLVIKTAGVYTKLILVPYLPAPYYSMQQFEQQNFQYFAYFILGLLVLTWVIIKRKEYRCTFYSLLFLIFLLPVLDPQIIPTNPRIALRFAYIPAILAGVFLSETMQFLKNKKEWNLFTGLLVIVALTWAVTTIHFQYFFKNEEDHYHKLVNHFPGDGSLLLPLALQKAMKAGPGNPVEIREALELINRALAGKSRDPWADISEPAGLLKANLLVISGDFAGAAEGKAIADRILAETQKKEMMYFAYLVLAKFHEKKQEYKEALQMLEKAESIGKTADLYYRMTAVSTRVKDFQKALQYLEKARELNPEIPKYTELKKLILKKIASEGTGDFKAK
jgi:hypothetical protein